MYSPSLRLSPRWRQPPHGSRPRVNWRHPLAQDLIFAVLPSAACYDLTDGTAPTFVGGNTLVGSAGKTALLGQSATSNFTHWGQPSKFDFTNTSSFSYFSVFYVDTGDGTARMFPGTRDNGAANRTLVQWNLTTGNQLRLVFGSAAAVLGFADGTTALTAAPNVFHTGAGVRDVAADKIRIYTDGVLETEGADASTGTWTCTGRVGSGIITDPTTASFCSLMGHALDLVWSRALTSEEVGWLHQDPYSLFEWDEQGPLSALVPATPTVALGAFLYLLPFENLSSFPIETLIAPALCGRAFTPPEHALTIPSDPATLATQGTPGDAATLASLAKPSFCGRAMTGAPPLGFGFVIEVDDPPAVEPDPAEPFPHVRCVIYVSTIFSRINGAPFSGVLILPVGSQYPDPTPDNYGGNEDGAWLFQGSGYIDDIFDPHLFPGFAPPFTLKGFDDVPDGDYTEPLY